MLTDKDMAMQIIDQMETLFLEVVVLESVLNVLVQEDWKGRRDRAMSNPEFRASAHERFAGLRDQVLAAPDLTTAVRDILQTLDDEQKD